MCEYNGHSYIFLHNSSVSLYIIKQGIRCLECFDTLKKILFGSVDYILFKKENERRA